MARKPKLPDCPPDETVRLVHISDLHLGQPGAHQWNQPQIREEFEHDLERMLDRIGAPPDLVLFTGDLAFSADPDEYNDRVDPFLDELSELIVEAGGGQKPLVVPVPGNHDVRWPAAADDFRFGWLRMYESPALMKAREQLWGKRDASAIAPLFEAYQGWFDARIDPAFKTATNIKDYHSSFFPGDFRLSIETPGKFHLGIVGLNSAWVQYTEDEEDEFKGTLVVAPQQYQAAMRGPKGCPPLMETWCHQALLLMHHPPGWMSETARREFESGVYSTTGAARFAACLHGHQHEGASGPHFAVRRTGPHVLRGPVAVRPGALREEERDSIVRVRAGRDPRGR